MRFVFRAWLLAVTSLQIGGAACAQTSPPAHQPAPWKRYCQPNDGFCFRYPASWKMLGEVFAGNGVVIAPEQKQEQSLWDEITVAMVAPPPEGDQPGLGLNGIIQQAAAGMRDAGQNFQTLQRQQRTVDSKPAEMLKAQYREKGTGREWIEELIFIEGPDSEIYSVALKCAPENLARLEPVLAEVVRTWTLPQPSPPTNPDSEGAPQGTPAEKTPAAKVPH